MILGVGCWVLGLDIRKVLSFKVFVTKNDRTFYFY